MAARGEEELLDDSFDKLEVDTLNQLEHEAFRSTQWKRSGYEETSLLLSDQQLPTWPSTTVQQARIHDQETARISQHHEAAGPVIRQPPSSDYGDLDEDNLLPVGDVETYRDDDKSVPLNPRIKPGLGGQWQLDQNQYSASTGLTPLPRVPQDIVPFSASIVNPQADAVHEAIQIQLRESERERESLRRALEEAQSAALAKTGEVSIIRANLAKTSKEFQRSMVAFEKAQADENARQLAEMEVAEKERQRVVTHNVFLQQELAEGVENFRRLKQSMREAAKQDGQSPSSEAAVDVSPMITPKKPSNLPGRDGFDDGEIIAPASRSLPARSRFGSPKTGNKRKRTSTGGSPGQALPLSQPRTGSSPSVGARHEPMMINEALVAKLQEEHGSFEFLQHMLGHRATADQYWAFETFSTYHLPSAPHISFSAIILDRLTGADLRSSSERFPVQLCKVFIDLWNESKKQKYFPPLRLIIDTLLFALSLETMVTAPGIIEVVPIVQATVDINLTPRFYRHDPLDLHPDISISDCLSLLHLVAIGCAEIESQIRTFWQSMGSEFVYMTLHYNQPLDQILHMIDVLQTSVLKNSFGPISGGNEQEQRISENGILSQLTALLMDSPIAVEDSQNPDEGELAKLRLDVLGLLSVICRNEHGGEVMASHPSVVGRLVHVIHDELDTLYDYRHGHEKSAQQINLATRILYHLLTRHSKHVNLKEKLSIIPGGTQKHLVCLTRLAMSRGLVLEAGIEDQVAGCAQRLLEDFVTPEEGEALIAAFSLSKT